MRVEIVVDTDLVKITNNAMLKHKSNMYLQINSANLQPIKKSKKKNKMLQTWIGSKVIQNTYKMMAFIVFKRQKFLI